jgi:iron(III) transport system substrate-binding protein
MSTSKTLVLLCALAVLLVGCADRSTRPRVVVYTPHGKELLRTYEAEFEGLHPDIDVQWIDMGAQQIYDRVRTEKERPQAAVWWGGPNTLFDKAAREGLLEPFHPSWANEVPESARDPEGRWYGTYLTPEVITFNNRLVSAEKAPSDWDDILDPKWKDRVLIRYPLASGTMRTIFGAMIMRQPTIEEGYLWLARLDVNTKTYPADPTQLYLKLAREEGAVTLWNMPDTDLQVRDNGYPFGYLIPESGTPVLTEGIGLVAGSRVLEQAKLFYEFVTTKEALIRQAHDFHRIPAREDIEPDQLPEWISAVEIRPMTLDWDRLSTEGPGWMQYWDENIKGRGADYLRENGR